MKKFIFLILITLIPFRIFAQEISASELDDFTNSTFKKLNIAGASVLVKQNGKILLNRGYGMADLSHDVPAGPETTYFLVGPGMFILSACMLQLIEQGKISLDDGVEKYLPEFPLQGHKVKIRHLMNSTSGIIDYHYLGDPLESSYFTPKATDEVVGLFSGRPFTTTEPDTRWDWSISNFALLTDILERVTGMAYKDYLQKNVIAPLGLKETTYLEEKVIVKHLARGYGKQGEELYPAYRSLFTYDPSLRISTSTGDLLKIWEGIKDHKIISAKSFTMMSTPEGVAKTAGGADPSFQFGYILRMKKVGDQQAMGMHGALPGFSSHCYYFPHKDLSIVVLANTSNQYANDIGLAIGLKMLGLPQTPDRVVVKSELSNIPVKVDEQKSIAGTYTLRLAPDPARHRSYDYYTRTLRVFTEHGQLEIQKLGDSPEVLLKQADGTYATNSSPLERITFDGQNGGAVSFVISEGGKPKSICTRIGGSDIVTFHKGSITK
jgi:CubicO group peptidase (beta-lactamase class C family)